MCLAKSCVYIGRRRTTEKSATCRQFKNNTADKICRQICKAGVLCLLMNWFVMQLCVFSPLLSLHLSLQLIHRAKKGNKGSLWSTAEGRDSEWNQNDLFGFWDRGAFTTSNFQCCLEFRTASKKDVREDDTEGAQLLKGSCLLLVSPKLLLVNLGGCPRHSTSLQVLLAEGPCHPVRGACRAGKAERWSWFQSKDYPEHCGTALAAGTMPLSSV